MTDAKHTPGPWVAALERGCHGVVAQSLPKGGANFVAIVGNDEDTPEREPERFANAHLIAAAPELLEALEDLLEVCAHSVGELNPREPIKSARAAIAKARGQA